RRAEMPGVDLRASSQIDLLEQFAGTYQSEYATFPRESTGIAHEYYHDNPSFRAVDAEILYCMVRHFRPRRMIEIGSGMSTCVAARAIVENQRQGFPCDFTAIEPFPLEHIKAGFPGLARLTVSRVQDVPLSEFAALEENDILFIDSTHILEI